MSAPASDRELIALQIARPVRSRPRVAARCALGLPTVFVSPPRLDDGEPFPTRYWLSCPVARRRVAQLEAEGGVRRAAAHLASHPAAARAMARAHARYARDRDRELPADDLPRPHGGVGGSRGGVKCLHAHLADHWAGNDNPIGRWTAERIEAPDCATPCVGPPPPVS